MSENLLITDGTPRFGILDVPLDRVNVEDFVYRAPMGGRYGPLRRWFGYNRFQYFGIVSDEILCGCALADTRILGVAFVYLYDTRCKKLTTFSFKSPFTLGMDMCNTPRVGQSRFRKSICQEYRADGSKSLIVDLGEKLSIQAQFSEAEPPFETLEICTRAGYQGWVYARKVAGVQVTGTVRADGQSWDLGQIDAFGHHDFSAGYMRHETWWNWACLSGRLPDGRRLGMNISCGVNETSFSENCLWIDGKLFPVGLAQFEFDREQPEQPWRVTTSDGVVDLHFEADGMHREKINAGFLASNFKQIFGRFEGTLRLPGSDALLLTGMRGFVEDQYARW